MLRNHSRVACNLRRLTGPSSGRPVLQYHRFQSTLLPNRRNSRLTCAVKPSTSTFVYSKWQSHILIRPGDPVGLHRTSWLGSVRWKTDPASPETTSGSKTNPETSPAAITAQLERRLRRVVSELNISDQVSVMLIALFTTIVLAAPFVVRQMRKSDRDDYSITSEDPVDDLTTIVNRAWEEDENGDVGSRKGALEIMLKDILRSQALQKAAQDFLIRILEAAEFQAAIGRLVKSLWTDLVNDKETVAQVIRLLQIAIQDPAVKNAAQQLVLEIIEDAEVKASIIEMIQSLGAEQPVLEATQSLLTAATHNTLNDPEILDHSMEFATDVVGDDVVQRSAGEALRKSVGHAVRPVSTVLLTAAGIGLIVSGVVAIGYARSTEQEIKILERAARALQSNASYGIMRIITWPGRVVHRIWVYAERAFWAPIAWTHRGFTSATERVLQLVFDSIAYVFHLPQRGLDAAGRGVAAIGSAVVSTMSSSSKSASNWLVSLLNSGKHAITTALAEFVGAVVNCVISFYQRCVASTRSTATLLARRGSRSLDAADQYVIDLYLRIVLMFERIWLDLRSKVS